MKVVGIQGRSETAVQPGWSSCEQITYRL